MTRYANVDKLVKAGYNMLSNDLELHDPIDWILAELDGFVIEVPTPHGDLIDREELLENAGGVYTARPEEAQKIQHEINKVLFAIQDAPTVVEAEGE